MIGYEELRAVLVGSAFRAVEAEDGPLSAGEQEIEFQVLEAGLDLDGLDRVARDYAEAALGAAPELTLFDLISAAFTRGIITGARATLKREEDNVDASD